MLAGTLVAFMLHAIPANPAANVDATVTGWLVTGSVALAVGLTVWHLRNGRVFTMLHVYLSILAWETCGGIVHATLVDGQRGVDALSDAIDVRLMGLGAVCLGYLAVACCVRLPTAAQAVQVVSLDTASRLVPGSVTRLCLAAVVFLALAYVGLLYKVIAAGGIGPYLTSAYQWRFGTHTDTVTDNTLVVIASHTSPTLVAIVAILAIATRQSWLSLRGRLALALLLFGQLFLAVLSGSRMGVALAAGVPLLAAHMQKPFARRTVIAAIPVVAVAAVAGNWLHYKAFELTAGWTGKSLEEASLWLLAPQGHLTTLAAVLETSESTHPLGSMQYALSAAVIVPRIVWTEKLPSDETGTRAVQAWSGLPTSFQMAPTDVGVAIACVGMPGIALITLTGLLYGLIDRALYAGLVGRSVVLGVCMTRVLVDQGMGVSSVAITVMTLIGSTAALCLILPARQGSGSPVSPDTRALPLGQS